MHRSSRIFSMVSQKPATPDAFEDAARAIMTTDTYPKLATRKALIGDVEVTINGFCKGAGMIAPDMATMLCFIFTDAAIASEPLQELLNEHVATTFNCMTVDGDTSTSDTCLLFATGTAAARGQAPVSKKGSKKLREFSAALQDLMRDLAIQVAKDGEGLTKFVTFEVQGAKSDGGGAQNRALVRQLPYSQDRHRRRGSELGPRRDGGRQIRRGRRPRQARDLVRRVLRGP